MNSFHLHTNCEVLPSNLTFCIWPFSNLYAFLFFLRYICLGSPSSTEPQQQSLEGKNAGVSCIPGMTVNSFGEKPWSESSNGGKVPSDDANVSKESDVNTSRSGAPESIPVTHNEPWVPTQEWVTSWKSKLPLQTIMRLLQVLVPQVEKICIDRGLTDESEILRFLQHGTLVGLLPVPHPILIRKYQPNPGTAMWFRTYMWGVVYLRNTDPPIWYDTDVKLFEIQRV